MHPIGRAASVRQHYIRGPERFRETEIQHLHGAVCAHLDVRGFQIAVNDSLFVRRFERLRDLCRDRERFIDR